MKNLYKFIFSVIICEGAGLIGSIFTLSSIPTWYAALNKPAFSPPNWVFTPVWTTLYFLMGISLYLVWVKKVDKKSLKGKAYQIFFAQLILNILWSIVFFGLKSPLAGFVVIVILWLSIIETIRRFAKVAKTASFLLYPYLIWVTLATILNFSIWVLNK